MYSVVRRWWVSLGLVPLFVFAGGVYAQGEKPDPRPAADAVAVTVDPDWRRMGPSFEGWGTALAWFANVTGRFPEPHRARLADLIFGRDGLALNIARYNIGGGDAPETAPYLRPGADLPGFWRRPPGASGVDWWNPDADDHWDWSADAGQRWWLDAVKARVAQRELIVEAFSNSPPYFMTRSAKVSGSADGLEDNLRPGFEGNFAQYLARVVAELERRHGIRFRTLSPLNEPNTPYWVAGKKQEGAHWTPQAQSRMFVALDKVLKQRGMSTLISGPDETNAQTFYLDWKDLTPEARKVIGQINVHSYEWLGKSGLRDVAQSSGKRLWMSEADLSPSNVREDFKDMRPAIALAQQIASDIDSMEPSAWVLWQAVENASSNSGESSNWGLIKADFAKIDQPEYHVTKKYWAFAQFTKFIRPGHRFVKTRNGDILVAQDPQSRRVVMVAVNPGLAMRQLRLKLPPGVSRVGVTCQAFVTQEGDDLAAHPARQSSDAVLVKSPPQSIVTVVVTPR